MNRKLAGFAPTFGETDLIVQERMKPIEEVALVIQGASKFKSSVDDKGKGKEVDARPRTITLIP